MKEAGGERREDPILAEDFQPAPPPLVPAAVAAVEAPPPGLFITWDGFKKYSYLYKIYSQVSAVAEREAQCSMLSGTRVGCRVAVTDWGRLPDAPLWLLHRQSSLHGPAWRQRLWQTGPRQEAPASLREW